VAITDPNEKGIIYYGTDYQYIFDLDKSGLKSPRHRDEQFILFQFPVIRVRQNVNIRN